MLLVKAARRHWLRHVCVEMPMLVWLQPASSLGPGCQPSSGPEAQAKQVSSRQCLLDCTTDAHHPILCLVHCRASRSNSAAPLQSQPLPWCLQVSSQQTSSLRRLHYRYIVT